MELVFKYEQVKLEWTCQTSVLLMSVRDFRKAQPQLHAVGSLQEWIGT
jgi:hypothetical protein